ncbi:DUF2807 domain-containing protein [Pseudoduganella sp. DS3]|uniref:DUF2807 domain-containing protein n=1 Tax=Pseudoduganella guangdongensis TaxID=2692179 RepID=A0A6N9HEU9_9BURK|nr:head GIN domain-containing protein [Pseudoduganella guangdongensis]MYN02108.1 DUF2807 domain-containing protein [Pseudoduganella guangdongensis]
MFRSMLLAALLFPAIALADEQVRKLDAFYGINVKGPINVYVDVGKAQNVTISGRKEYLDKVSTVVEGGVLRVVYENTKKGSVTIKESDKLTVTVPALTSFRVLGAGESRVTNIHGERIDISFEGAGALHASGKVKLLRMKGQGVGQVDAKGLKAERADVNFAGMGDISVYASDTLNLIVEGMGNFTYYGNPKHLNKSVTGLGNISAGK